MTNLKYWLGLALLSWSGHAFAQNEDDALRYSRLQFGGSARSLGIGGATSALGGDIGSIVSNPAGLGFFQKSELSFTPGLGSGTTQSNSGDASISDSRNSLHVGNVGVVFANRRPDSDNTSDWRAGNVGLSITRLNDFNTRFRYARQVSDNASFFERLRHPTLINNSIPNTYDDIYSQGNKGVYSSLDGVAYGAYLTDLRTTNNVERLVTIPRNGPIAQSETVLTTGSQTQYDLAYGASYRDRFYIGGAIGVVSAHYDETKEFTEAENDPNTSFVSLLKRNTLTTKGTGFNLRIGAIYRVNDFVRFGASAQTPTFLRLTDTYSTSINTTFSPALKVSGNPVSSGFAKTDPGEYTYNITTPFRATGGVAVVIGKYGFLTGDVEYVDYSTAKLGSSDGDGVFDVENQAIKSRYQSAVNLRIGGEARFDIFRARVGYARYGDPFKVSDFDRTQNYFTGGLGLRQSSYFLDLAGVYRSNKTYYVPYALNQGVAPISVKDNRFTTSVTVGLNF